MAPRVQTAPSATSPFGVAASIAALSSKKETKTKTTLLGKYEMGRLLGRGSFAKVYSARGVCDGAAVAIKVIDKLKTVGAAMEPRIVREVDAMRRLRHPNVLRIHEVMATKSKIYLVMELAKGGDLFSKLARHGGRLPEAAARRYFQQLVAALDYCHLHGVAHRDVKPQNLLLDEHGNVKLSDFGLSAAALLPEQNPLLHTACGTPAFTAPEVVCRRRSGGGTNGYDGAKADAWSCGVILFAFLAGFLPFDDSNLAAMYQKIRRREFQIPDHVSKPSRLIITRLLDPNPESRMNIETLMKSSWFRKSLQSNTAPATEMVPIMQKDCGNFVMNAFDIISMSSGLDLSGLFEAATRRWKRFTAAATAEKVAERVTEEGEKNGYNVRREKGGGVRMEKGRTVLMAEMREMAPALMVVEMKVTEGGEGVMELEELLQWRDLEAGLGDLVLQWHNIDGL